jgi:hypothetical protein
LEMNQQVLTNLERMIGEIETNEQKDPTDVTASQLPPGNRRSPPPRGRHPQARGHRAASHGKRRCANHVRRSGAGSPID